MAFTDITKIDPIAELQRIGDRYTAIGEDELKLLCPAHVETDPSCVLNVAKRVWVCHSCKADGDIVSFLALRAGVTRKVALLDLADRYDLIDVKTISLDTVEKYRAKYHEAGPLLKALRERGITDDMARHARLGYHDGRITIPVFDASGRCVNVRRYLPGAPSDQKMRNTSGYGKVKLYQVETLKSRNVACVFGGEIKAVVAYHTLGGDASTVACVSTTGGEGSWDDSFNPLFDGKTVFVCMDVDPAGVAAARRVAGRLLSRAASVWLCDLPIDRAKYPKGDVNDWIGREGAGRDDLVSMFANARPFTPDATETESTESVQVALLDAVGADSVGKRVDLIAVVTSVDQTPYLVPDRVKVTCTRDEGGCATCPVFATRPDDDGSVERRVPSTSSFILEMVGAPKKEQANAVRSALGIPSCKSYRTKIESWHAVNDVRLSPRLELGEGDVSSAAQPALLVRKWVELNQPYAMSGRVHPNPRSQQAMLLLDRATETQDSLNSYAPEASDLAELTVFQARPGLDFLRDKLASIYDDLSHNVTRIFGRRRIHELTDLTYHSVLGFDAWGKSMNGWVNSIVVGDTSQGKSEVTSRLKEHYGLGERVEMKNATVAGLLGGLQQTGTRWMVSWGVIPRHDRRLVILEEVKGASVEVIAKLTDMRSSGVAEIPKIERRKAAARTRLLFISNPRGHRSMSSYNFGVEAILELVGSLEDVRRFDVAVTVNEKDLTADDMRPNGTFEHVHTSDLCRRLVLWAWTRKPSQVRVRCVPTIEEEASALCATFSESVPLIDKGTVRQKLARLACAVAARVFSTADGEHLDVLDEHARHAASFLREAYSDKSFGYADYSRARALVTSMTDPEEVRRRIINARYPADLVRQFLHRDDVTIQDIQDWYEVDQDAALRELSFYVRKHALKRGDQRFYVKTPDFITLLKSLEGDARLKEVRRDEKERF